MSIIFAVAIVVTTVAAAFIGKAIADLIEAAVRWACRH